MKTKLLLTVVFLYLSVALLYFSFKHEIKSYLETFLIPLCSIKNPKIIAVFYSPILGFTYSPDDPIPISNTNFNYTPQIFSIDDTSNLKAVNLACKPISFGYSIEDGNARFPPYTYPKCSNVWGQNDTYLHIDRESQSLYMDCPQNFGSLIKGPIQNNRFMQQPEGAIWDLEQYDKPIDASKLEYGLGSCGRATNYQQGAMVPIFNETLFNLSKAKTNGKPKILFFLSLDSLSRRHYFRKLPSVIDLFNNFSTIFPNFTVHDFKLHNILGEDTIGNQVPILGGKDKFVRDSGNKNIDYLGESALWNILRDKGYISLLGLDDCDFNFPRSIGQNPRADYKVRQFYCAVELLSRVSAEEINQGQRCLGGHQTHYYMLNYTMSLVKMYEGSNIWIYLHLNAAHDGLGQHAATLNDDIREFLIDFLGKFQEKSDIAIFLNGDHGMRYGEWYTESRPIKKPNFLGYFLLQGNRY